MGEAEIQRSQNSVPIGWWLATAAFAVSLVVVLIGVHGLAVSREYVTRDVRIQCENLAQSISHNLTFTFQRIDHSLLSMVHVIERNLATGQLDLVLVKQWLAFEKKLLPEAVAIRVTDAEGRLILGDPFDDPSVNLASRSYFTYLRDHPKGKNFIAKPAQGLFTHKWVIVSARRYDLPNDHFGGAVIISVPVECFQKALAGFQIGSSGILTVRDTDNGFVVRYPAETSGYSTPIGDKTISRELLEIVNSGVSQETYSAATLHDQSKRLIAFQRLDTAPFFVVTSFAEDDYLVQWNRDVILTSLMILIFLVGLWSATWFLWRFWKSRERSARALHESAERLRTILQTTMDGFWMVDVQGRVMEVNETYCNMSGYSQQELLMMQISDVVADETHDETNVHIRRVLSQGADRFESRHRRKDGSVFDVEVSAQRWPASEGQSVAFLRDISLEKQARLQIEESEARYRTLVDSIPNTTFLVFDRNKRFQVVSGKEVEKTGYDKASLLGKTLAEVFSPEVVELFSPLYDKALLGETISFEHKHRNFYYHQQILPIRDGSGEICSGMVVSHNITERKWVEQERDRFEEQLRQREKMDAIGQLAGGVAHDFNRNEQDSLFFRGGRNAS